MAILIGTGRNNFIVEWCPEQDAATPSPEAANEANETLIAPEIVSDEENQADLAQ
jgi:hypothetical protein